MSIGWLAITAFAIVAGLNQVLKLSDTFKEKPAPADTYVTLKECAAKNSAQDLRIARVECASEQLRSELKDMDLRSEQRAAALHDRINLILAAVSEIRGELRQATATRPNQP